MKVYSNFSFCFILLALFHLLESDFVFGQQTMTVIPAPAEFNPADGYFSITSETKIVVDKKDIKVEKTAQLLATFLLQRTGKTTLIKYKSHIKKHGTAIIFKKDTTQNIPNEGYKLTIKANVVEIIFSDPNGAFYGLQTLLQLFPVTSNEKNKTLAFPVKIGCCEIYDYPRYPYRGMHLDVSRHFFPVSFIKKYIDLMAIHKFNTFHWHLTDDQGWRIEIKKYPLLTGIGSLRKESMTGFYDDQQFDGTPYGGFYTQEEIKEVIAYASERFVTIIPEIEMPGHSRAAIAAYPELACSPSPYEVATYWGVFNDVFCPTEKTFTFLEDVLTEVCTLFPSSYVHIGGDECPKISWKNSAFCQQLMKTENLKDEHELQSYFIKRVEKILSSKGKKLIGWDEILEGGLASGATVMSWRGINGGIAAARQHHDVIMTPGTHCYFDHYQSDPSTEPIAIGGYTTIQKVYQYEPTPVDSLTADEQKYILGAQGNVWTEYITGTSEVEYMAYPRACALAEVLWTPKVNRNWENFSNRLIIHLNRLDAFDVNYAKSIFDITAGIATDTTNTKLEVSLYPAITGGHIRYTTDGTEPNEQSNLFTSPVKLEKSTTLKGKLYVANNSGKMLTKTIQVHKATGCAYSLADKEKQYDGGTKFGLTDGVTGIKNRYNSWVGFSGKDLVATLDLKKQTDAKLISINFYNKNRAWIFLPKKVTFDVSDDNINFTTLYQVDNLLDTLPNSIFNVNTVIKNKPFRYLKITAVNTGKCPPGHEAAGNDAWLFADEVVVE